MTFFGDGALLVSIRSWTVYVRGCRGEGYLEYSIIAFVIPLGWLWRKWGLKLPWRNTILCYCSSLFILFSCLLTFSSSHHYNTYTKFFTDLTTAKSFPHAQIHLNYYQPLHYSESQRSITTQYSVTTIYEKQTSRFLTIGIRDDNTYGWFA